MSQTNETTRLILQELFKRKIFAWRQNTGGIPIPGTNQFRPAAKKGVADILACIPTNGRLLAIEVKTGKDHLSPEQEGFLINIRNSGGVAFVVEDFPDFKSKLDKYLSPP